MNYIFKYEIPIKDYFELNLPKNARILSIQCQLGLPKIWCVVDPHVEFEIRKFTILGTGYQMGSAKMEYIETFQINEGNLVFHLFEIINE